MAQNITLLGASYSAVPAVELPKTGGGTATFTDTSDATATADKILTGYSAYVNGTKIDGTATQQAISIVDTLDSHGGTIRTITATGNVLGTKSITQNGTYDAEDDNLDGYASVSVNVSGGTYNWMGQDAELIATALNETLTFEDLGLDSWTPSTTSTTTLRSSTKLLPVTELDIVNYNYVVVMTSVMKVVLRQGQTETSVPIKSARHLLFAITRTVSESANADTTTKLTCKARQNAGAYLLRYVNNVGNAYTTTADSRPVFISPTWPQISYANDAHPDLAFYTPSISARCDTSYCPTTAIEKIDMEQSTIANVIKLYRVDVNNNIGAKQEDELIALFNSV